MTEMSRLVALDRVGPGGLDMVVEAAPEELAPIATRLLIPAVRRLRCEFKLRRVDGGVIAADGVLQAEVVQVCVVSLDEFAHPLEEEFSVLFVPSGTETEDADPESPDQIPYNGGAIDLGEAAIEQLALDLDPYPHKPGAEEPADIIESDPNPFAKLAALRLKQ